MAGRARHHGAMLIEGLVAITIFSFGILAVVGMMATHIGTAGDARYRMEAAQFAESILADMRIANADVRAVNFSGPDGTSFSLWSERIKAASGLPMADSDAEPLEIDVDGNNVSVTIRWRAPSDRGDEAHRYTTVSAL